MTTRRLRPLFGARSALSPTVSTNMVRLSAAVLTILFLSGCPKKNAVKVPLVPPPVPPAVAVKAEPSTIKSGESIVLNWKTENATEARLEPLGYVQINGSKSIALTQSTDFKLVAIGPGGSREATSRSDAEEDLPASIAERQDIFFGNDEYLVPPEQENTIAQDAQFLHDHPDLHILIEGHCDQNGSIEYNLALGASRAGEVRSGLVKAGVQLDRIRIISLGKERPFCFDESENCLKLNRRAHVVPVNP
jgi:peptidoglycan-associated lipoprotein